MKSYGANSFYNLQSHCLLDGAQVQTKCDGVGPTQALSLESQEN